MTQYLYDRDNPKSHLRQRITGAEGFFYGLPNMYERAEMVARTIGKRCDGDLTRFAQMSKKPRDDAQRWRAFKNIVRFHRNPLGYAYWKTQPFFQKNRVRILYIFLFYHMYNTLMLVVHCRGAKRKMIEDYAAATGRVSNRYTGISAQNRMPHDMKKNYVRYSNFHQMRRNKQTSKMHLPWWSRDQNFRKYFEMRKKHGIKPSLTGFANDKHYENYMKKATNFYEQREKFIEDGNIHNVKFIKDQKQ